MKTTREPPQNVVAAVAFLGGIAAFGIASPWASGGSIPSLLGGAVGILAITFGAATVTGSDRRGRSRQVEVCEVDYELKGRRHTRTPVRWKIGPTGDVVPLGEGRFRTY